MSQFREFDIPEEMGLTSEGTQEKPAQKPVEQRSEPRDKVERTSSAPRPRAASRAAGSLSSLIGKLVNPLLVIAGGWYVYNWFIVDKHGFNDDGSVVALVVGAVAAFSAFNFVAALIGKAIGGIFRVFRTLIGLALFGFLIYSVINFIK